MTHSLLFDDTLELCDPTGVVSGGSYWFETLADGASWGDPQPVEVAINSLMRDGAIVATAGDGNREVTFLVKVRGTDSDSLDAGVQALQMATRKRTTLVWTPPDGYCEPRVWDVETSNLLEPNGFDDLAYMMRNEQVFRLRLVCLPFRRSVGTVIDNAGTPPISPGSVFLNCESTSGWATYDLGAGGGWTAPSFAVDSTIFAEGTGSIKSLMTEWDAGRVYNVGNGTGGTLSPARGTSRDQVTGLSLSTGTGGYLSVAIRGEAANTTTLTRMWTSTSAGVWTEVASWTTVKRDANGFVHYAWAVGGGQTIIGLRFQVEQRRSASNQPRPYTWYDDFELLPTATTDHQIVKQLYVEGSARTTGSLHVASPNDIVGLGKVLVITAPTDALPDGFQPDGRRWVTQGATATDSTSPDGSYYTPSTSSYDATTGKPIFDIPVDMLTAGPYTVVALVKVVSSPTVAGVQAQLRVGTTNVGSTSAAEVSIPNLPTGWQFVPVGTVYLPPVPMQSANSSAKVRLLFKGAALSNIYMIPAWQVNGRSVADFSIVDCGSGVPVAGGPSSHLWIDSPSTSQPQGGWWRGPTADRINAQSAWPDAKKPGIHTFNPGSLTAFLVSTDAQGPSLDLEYHRAYL